MSRVITFSRTFPSYHPKAGQSTRFVEKVAKSIGVNILGVNSYESLLPLNEKVEPSELSVFIRTLLIDNYEPKHHTIRAGNRWKVGDKFSPRVWSGKPYNSKMITIAPDIEIKKIWEIEIDKDACILINGELYAYSSSTELLNKLAENDGLNQSELLDWFKYPKPFKGQIICWNDKIEY